MPSQCCDRKKWIQETGTEVMKENKKRSVGRVTAIVALLLFLAGICTSVLASCDPAKMPDGKPSGAVDGSTADTTPVTSQDESPVTTSDETTDSTSSSASEAADTDTRSAAEKYSDGMTIEECIGQMFFARCPDSGALAEIENYHPGGYILFARDFVEQTPGSVQKTIAGYQHASGIPMLIGVDEEGGTVVRVSKYPAFRGSPFLSQADLYNAGGIDGLLADAKEKDALLKSLGINVNLGPVCDISQNPKDYIYKRTIGKDAETTAACIRAIVSQMVADDIGVALKHFPGYGSNVDTHTGIAVDERDIEVFRQSEFLPFMAGISAGAGSVMVNHNIVNCMDPSHPATLSPEVHRILREELGFQGVIMTDDLSMRAITKWTDGQNAAVAAVLAGNDLLISSDFVEQYNAVLSAVRSGIISEEQIRASVIRIINWKISLGLIPEE